MKKGHIRFIDNKVKFEYHELEKLEFSCFGEGDDFQGDPVHNYIYNQAMVKYEASKRSVKISNVSQDIQTNEWLIKWNPTIWKKVINGQSCEAEVTDNKATIIELTKE